MRKPGEIPSYTKIKNTKVEIIAAISSYITTNKVNKILMYNKKGHLVDTQSNLYKILSPTCKYPTFQ